MIVCQGVPFSRGILCQGSAPLIPFSRGVLCQGPLFPFLKGWQLPLSQGAPLMLHPPFCKGCPFSRIIPGSHPFPKGCSFPKEFYPFARIQRPNFIIGVQLMWGTLSCPFVLCCRTLLQEFLAILGPGLRVHCSATRQSSAAHIFGIAL